MRRGSAFLFVLGVVFVLTIIIFFYSRSTVSRRFSTRLMSNEKRAEALAESAVDLAVDYLKGVINDGGDPNFYPYFRLPLALQGNSLGDSNGINVPLDPAPCASVEMDQTTPALSPIQGMITELGGDANVDLKLSCQIVEAEAFSSCSDGYQVVGASVKAPSAQGDPARFLDSLSVAQSGGGIKSNLFKDWALDFFLPNKQPSDQRPIQVDAGFWSFLVDIDAKVFLTKLSPTKVMAVIKVKVEDRIFGGTVFEFGPPDPKATYIIDFEDTIKGYLDLGSDPVTLLSILKKAMGTDVESSMDQISWRASILQVAINAGYNALPAIIRTEAEAGDPFSPPRIVEKAGILRLKAEVEYHPNGPNGPKIKRVLIADRDFKVSDIQPVAPEYSFFVANSEKLIEPGDNFMGETFGNPIDWNAGLATVSIHNLPTGKYEGCTGLTGGGGDSGANSTCQVPGMVRINSNGMMQINTFLGTVAEPQLTEFNAMMMDREVPASPFKLVPTFQWNPDPEDREHEIDFPVVKQGPLGPRYLNTPTGVKNLIKMLDFCDAISAPTLLFGTGHFEYPLGLRAESQLQMKYGNLKISVQPIGDKDDPRDRTEVFFSYENKARDYGIIGLPPYQSNQDWDPDFYKNMPPNLSSVLQYAKKATHFYNSQQEFKGDPERFSGGVFQCDGVTYIKGDLDITGEFKVKGRGILVVKDIINVSGNILRQGAPGETVFSLIARRGYIRANSGVNRIEASCYSNYCFRNPSGNALIIDGNLVVNHFNRDHVGSLEVAYNSAACRVSPLSVMRDVGKFDPKRYITTIGKRWVRYEYEKQP